MAMSGITFRQVLPNCNASAYVVTYSKAGATDTLTMSTNTPIVSVKFACATDDSAGAEDPVTYATSVVTFSAGTGAGRVLVIGTC